MLDPIIKAHIKEQDVLEKQLRDDIDILINNINVDKAIDDPESEFLRVAEAVEDLIIERYADRAIDNGVKIAKKLEGMKRDIKIQTNADPDENKESEKELLEARSG